MQKNKMRIAILKQLRNEMISTYELATSLKMRRESTKQEFVREVNHLASQDVIIPVYENGTQYLLRKSA